jgi:GDP-4-dehydro-6-deoxy-D-mannose reductase
MQVGNLAAERDFTDVRDVVRAYHMIIEHGEPGTAYNIASTIPYSIQELLDTLLSYSSAAIDVQVDPARMLPVDVPLKVGDYQRLNEATGWRPEIPFEQTLSDLLEDCRQRST